MASSPFTRKAVLHFIQKIEIKATRYLDVGGSDGALTIEMAKLLNAKEVHIVDVSDEALATAASRGLQAHKVDLNNQKLPFANDYFDFVTLIEVLEHLIDTDHALKEVNRVLKPGSYLLISTPNLASRRNRMLLLLGFYPEFAEVSFEVSVSGRRPKVDEEPSKLGVKHIRLYTLGALKFQLAHHGFGVISVAGAPTAFESAPRTPFYRFLARIDILLSRRPSLAPGIIVLAKKVA